MFVFSTYACSIHRRFSSLSMDHYCGRWLILFLKLNIFQVLAVMNARMVTMVMLRVGQILTAFPVLVTSHVFWMLAVNWMLMVFLGVYIVLRDIPAAYVISKWTLSVCVPVCLCALTHIYCSLYKWISYCLTF